MNEPPKKLWTCDYGACLLPLAAALLIVGPYFLFLLGTGKSWKVNVKGEGAEAKDVVHGVFQLGCLPEDPNNSRCLLSGTDALGDKLRASPEVKDGAAPGVAVEDWGNVVSASGLSAWQVVTGLTLAATACVLIVSCFIVWQTVSYPDRSGRAFRGYISVGLLVALCALLFGLAGANFYRGHSRFGDGAALPLVAREYLQFVESHVTGLPIVFYESSLSALGFAAAFALLCASGATLVSYRRWNGDTADEAKYLAMQMRHLRMVLYSGALLLALTALRQKAEFDLALGYLPPLWPLADAKTELQTAAAFYGELRKIAMNNVTAVGVMNTLLLAALYVPAALVIRKRADDLSERVVREQAAGAEGAKAAEEAKAREGAEPGEKKKQPGREEWLKSYGLAFPLQENLARVAAILAPLLAGPVSELFSFLK